MSKSLDQLNDEVVIELSTFIKVVFSIVPVCGICYIVLERSKWEVNPLTYLWYSFGFIVVSLLFYLYYRISRVTLNTQGITYYNSFHKETIAWNKIHGCKIVEGYKQSKNVVAYYYQPDGSEEELLVCTENDNISLNEAKVLVENHIKKIRRNSVYRNRKDPLTMQRPNS
ncbi:MAG: hypothetical protein MJZ02_05775 [Paludibacteraceae bacterium]|nr:hypothetical protein [Paludibacteraceae bacterium]